MAANQPGDPCPVCDDGVIVEVDGERWCSVDGSLLRGCGWWEEAEDEAA